LTAQQQIPALNYGDGIAMILRWRKMSDDEAQKRYVTQILLQFPRRILLCATCDTVLTIR